MTMLKPNDHVLFFGDSITDAGRRNEVGNNGGLGTGYTALCAGMLKARHPELNLQVSNRGTSGNRIYDLEARLQTDVLDLKPTLVSILIGINDTWRRFDKGVPSPIEEFQACYERIGRAIVNAGARLIICEPFLLPIPEDRVCWREDLDPRITACRDVARLFGAAYLPLDGLFAQASCRQSLDYWLPDGVHPSLAGHALIADAWLQLVASA